MATDSQNEAASSATMTGTKYPELGATPLIRALEKFLMEDFEKVNPGLELRDWQYLDIEFKAWLRLLPESHARYHEAQVLLNAYAGYYGPTLADPSVFQYCEDAWSARCKTQGVNKIQRKKRQADFFAGAMSALCAAGYENGAIPGWVFSILAGDIIGE